MASDADKSGKSDKVKKLTQEQIIATFNQLRQEQKNLVSKLTDLEQEHNEHSLVVDALKDIEGGRKCYRMIGGILVERTVKEVLPAVTNNKEQLAKVIEALNQKIETKGGEINTFKEKHDIQIHLRREAPAQSEKEPESSSSVLVDKT